MRCAVGEAEGEGGGATAGLLAFRLAAEDDLVRDEEEAPEAVPGFWVGREPGEILERIGVETAESVANPGHETRDSALID